MSEQVIESGEITPENDNQPDPNANLQEPEGGAELQSGEAGVEPAEAAAAADEGLEPEGGEQHVDGVQKRINELTRQRKEAEEREAQARQQAAYYQGVAEAGGQGAQPVQQVEPEKVLTLADFEYDNEAYMEHRLNLQKKEFQEQLQVSQNQSSQAVMAENIQKQYRAGVDKYDDFEQVISNPANVVNQTMLNAIDPDMLGEVMYFFGKHPAESTRIARMGSAQAIKAIGALEDKIINRPKPVVKQTSAADPPVNKAGAGSLNPAKPLNEMSQKELMRKWDIERLVKLTGCTAEQAAAQI